MKLCMCGQEITGKQRTRCRTCAINDPHRHKARCTDEMVVSIDCEGQQDEHGIMHKITCSYGREDGSSGTLSRRGNYLTGQEIVAWLIEELSGHYFDVHGKEWRQALVSFHFNWDTAVIAKDFTEDMILVHKAVARKRNLLCNAEHNHEIEGCGKFGRYDNELIQDVITDGGEDNLLALHKNSGIGITTTPKRRFYAEYRPQSDLYQGNSRIDIHDTGTAFVGTLLEVIEHWQPALTEEQKSIIEWGKGARKAGFLHGTINEVARYSEAECIAHARCVRLLLETIRDASNILIKPSQLFGAGSIASAAFKHHGLQTRMETHNDNKKWESLLTSEIARLTYFGGLIETPCIGWIRGQIDERDLNSAYPASTVKLPCMRTGHGHWERHKIRYHEDVKATQETVGHVLCSWAVEAKSTPPFVVRTTEGLVRQPLVGHEVWVTMPEYLAAYAQFGDVIVATRAIWWAQECNCPPPFAWIEKFYNARLAIKTTMKSLDPNSIEWWKLNVRQAILKLIIVSAYGKLAQQRPTLGRYTNLHYAGYITGSTRASVRSQSWMQESNGGTIVYTHTDSVLSRNANPPDGGTALGAWGAERPMADILIIQPGLAISISGGKLATRGCHKSDFRSASAKWCESTNLTSHPTTWPAMKIPRVMMISRRQAIARGKPEIAGSFRPQPLTLNWNSGKRDFQSAYQIPDNPTGWIIPPIEFEPFCATIKDLKVYNTTLDTRLKSGDFDHVPGEMTFDDITDDELDDTKEFVW
jgi:hypothetical protein